MSDTAEQIMPDADLTPNLEAPETDMPEELKEQKARASAEKTVKRLESRIRSLTELIREDEDGTRHYLREIVDEYIAMGGEEFSLELICERLGFDLVRVRKMIVQRDGNPNREPFTSILRAVERPFQKINLMKMRVKAAEIALHEPEETEDGISEDYHPKDKLAAMQRYLQLGGDASVFPEDEEEGDGEGGIAYPDSLAGHQVPEDEDE